jgi:hypothetical protein
LPSSAVNMILVFTALAVCAGCRSQQVSPQNQPQQLAQRHQSAADPARAGSAKGAAGSGQVWKMRKVSINEQVTDLRTNGNLQLTGIMTMLVPTGWSFEGASFVAPKLDCTFTSGRFIFLASSPDKTTGLRVTPTGTAIWSTNRQVLQQVDETNHRPYSNINCPIVQTKPLSQMLSEAAPKLIDGGTPVGQTVPVPGMSDQLAASVQQANQQLGGQGSRISAEAGRLRVTGTMNGKPVEAWLIGLHTVRTDPAPGGGVIELSDLPLFAIMFAPPGQLDSNEKMLSAMLDSVEISPEWTSYCADYVAKLVQIRQQAMNQVSQIYANMAKDNAIAAAQQQGIRSGVQQHSNDVHSRVANDRAAALDHSSQQFALHMGDQAIYKDPTTGERVQMSNQYSHAWASTTGNANEYILTDSPSYDPNGQAGSGSWTQMQQEH